MFDYTRTHTKSLSLRHPITKCEINGENNDIRYLYNIYYIFLLNNMCVGELNLSSSPHSHPALSRSSYIRHCSAHIVHTEPESKNQMNVQEKKNIFINEDVNQKFWNLNINKISLFVFVFKFYKWEFCQEWKREKMVGMSHILKYTRSYRVLFSSHIGSEFGFFGYTLALLAAPAAASNCDQKWLKQICVS